MTSLALLENTPHKQEQITTFWNSAQHALGARVFGAPNIFFSSLFFLCRSSFSPLFSVHCICVVYPPSVYFEKGAGFPPCIDSPSQPIHLLGYGYVRVEYLCNPVPRGRPLNYLAPSLHPVYPTLLCFRRNGGVVLLVMGRSISRHLEPVGRAWHGRVRVHVRVDLLHGCG